MDNPPRYVSGQSLFSMVEEQLASGKRVRFPVSGTSMTPWIIHNRDQIELISAKGLRLKKGDIILFQPFSGKYILHRITKIVPSGYITTGDGNLYRESGHHTPEGQTHQLQRPAVAHPFLALDGALPVSKMDACVFDLHTKVHEKS